MTETPAKYLDKILDFMANDFNKYHTIQEIQNHLTPIEFFGQKGLANFSEGNLVDLKNALYYLNQEKLVAWNNASEIKLTYSGYIKIKTNSFQKEIKDKEINKWLQRIAWTLPIIISIAALIVSILK